MDDTPQPGDPGSDDPEPGDAHGPTGDGEPFSGFPDFPGLPGLDFSGIDFSGIDLSEVTRMLQSQGPLNLEIARQVATAMATGGNDEPAIGADEQHQVEELARAAQTHVVAETGLSTAFSAPVRALGRQDWAALHLDALRPVLEVLATTLGSALSPEALRELLPEEGEPDAGDPFAAILPMLAPLLLGVQAGSMVGHLSTHALGRYDLPLPTSDAPGLVFVIPNLDQFEQDWTLDRADLRFYVAIHEAVHAGVRGVPWVSQRLVDLATDYVSAYDVDADALETRLDGRFENLDPRDPESIRALAAQPEELLGALRSERQHALLARARVFHGVLGGFADEIVMRVAGPLITSFDRIHEAMARHRIERGEAEQFIGGLLGLATDRADYERGGAFCRGVVERAGPEGLNRLWDDATKEPTLNEMEAPGLWLARIDLDADAEDPRLDD